MNKVSMAIIVPAAVVILGDRFWWPRHPSTRDASAELRGRERESARQTSS